MYGHGAQPPTRTSGTVILLRVLFAAAGILSCGLLACLPLFRVAVLRRRRGDWLLAWLSLPLSVVGFAVVGALPESDSRSDIALTVLFLLSAFSTAYFLVFDIDHHRTAPPFGKMPSQTTAVVPPGHTTPVPPQPGYGLPPGQPYVVTQPPTQPSPPPYAPVPPSPQPQHPAPARIDQVRAELDELSDYLRKHEDGR